MSLLNMNIAVIGLGSMGKRRIRLLNEISKNINIFGVDSRLDRQDEVLQDFNDVLTYSSIKELVKSKTINAAIVSTSPLSHAEIIKELLSLGIHVFTEINLVNDLYLDNIQRAKENNKILFLSSTFLYREEIKYIYNRVSDQEQPIRYNYHVGQYLPDWHPWENFKDFFVNDTRTNGCRELFAIELPWIITVFGEIKSVTVNKSKISNLDISYPDNYQLIITHLNGNVGLVNFNIVSRKAVRNLEVISEKLYLDWDGTPDGLNEYNISHQSNENISLYENVTQNSNYSSTIIENAYKEELLCFFKCIKEGVNNNYNFTDDLSTLEWIDVIEYGS